MTGGSWHQGETARAVCARCSRWIIGERAWHYWVGLVRKASVCDDCAKAL